MLPHQVRLAERSSHSAAQARSRQRREAEATLQPKQGAAKRGRQKPLCSPSEEPPKAGGRASPGLGLAVPDALARRRSRQVEEDHVVVIAARVARYLHVNEGSSNNSSCFLESAWLLVLWGRFLGPIASTTKQMFQPDSTARQHKTQCTSRGLLGKVEQIKYVSEAPAQCGSRWCAAR